MRPKSILALATSVAFAFPSIVIAFQPHSSQRSLRCSDVNNLLRNPASCRRLEVPSKLVRAALPRLKDESYPNTLPPSPKGVIFDMDGTLIQHAIDFADMRRRIYSVADADSIGKDLERDCVLALADALSLEGQEACKLIFSDIEQRALDDMKLMDGGAEFVQFLAENGLKRAVLTRNLEKNVSFMKDLYLAEINKSGGGGDSTGPIFHPIVARDTRSHPSDEKPLKSKPYPDGILHICDVWGFDPSEVIMVGDNANDDIAAANRAGCGGSVLLTQPGGDQLDTHSGYDLGESEEDIMERTPSLRVESLLELKTCLEALLNELDVSDGKEQSNSDSYSIEIPPIGVKNV